MTSEPVTRTSIPEHLHPKAEDGWRQRAGCQGADLYPAVRSGPRAEAVYARLAAKFCHTCPVRPACLWTALGFESGDHQHRYGLFGALSPRQRTDLALVLLVLSGGLPSSDDFMQFCACGCGRELELATVGRPRRFIAGHESRKPVAA